ncbi:MAG: hypothetical protein ACT4TC_10670 [Myxococcaceae bacterium]
MRGRLETARLELRALYRALDRLLLAQDFPDELRQLAELDADFGEALWVLDRPRSNFDMAAMTRDTEASLARLPASTDAFLGRFDAWTRARLVERAAATRTTVQQEDAYLDIPGREPMAR